MSYITFENVTKEYHTGGETVLAANNVCFEMEKGELSVVLGPSGAGKTTILNLLGGMDRVTSGKIIVDGKEITSLTGRELTEYRRLDVGFVFQFYNLMPNLTALENVELARQVCPRALDPVEVLKQVGLGERMNNFPAQLSGGEQQRVAIARALAKNPKLLRRKLVCDMWHNRMQFLAVILLCALGTWVFSGLDAAWRMLDLSAQTYFDEQNVADIWITLSSADREAVERVRGIAGVEDVQARATAELTVDLPHEPSLVVEAYDGTARINRPLVREGSNLQSSDLRGCLLDELFARENGLAVGDRIGLKVGGQVYDFLIRGTCLSPEFVSLTKNSVRDPLNYGFILINNGAIGELPLNSLVVTLTDGTDVETVEAAVSAYYPDALMLDSRTQNSVHGIASDAGMYRSLSYVFPLLAYAVAAMIVLTTITRMLENQRTQMGCLKALGYRDGQIQRHYLCYAFYPALVGSVLGLFVGRQTLPYILWNMESARYTFPRCLQAPISWEQWAVCGLGVLLSCLICLRTYRRSAREVTAALLRPRPPRAGQKLFLERLGGLWSRLGFNAKMVCRNLLRNKARTLMSLIGALCCTMLIITSLSLSDSVKYFVGKYYEGTLRYTVRAKLDAGAGAVEGYRKRVEAQRVEGVMDKSVSIRLGDAFRATTLTVLEDDQRLMNLGADETWMPLPADGVLLSRKLAEALGAQVGDRVNLWLTGDSDPVSVTVSGVAEITIGQTVFMSRTVWDGCKKGDFVPTALHVLSPTQAGLDYLSGLDEFEEFQYPPSEMADTLKVLESLQGVFRLMAGAALGLAFVVLYNMGILNFVERCREYATLKVLGYHQREIRRLILTENALVSGLGVLMGILPGWWLTGVVFRSCETDTMVFISTVTPTSVLLACTVTFAFSCLITGLLTRKVRTIDMVEALKSVE